jgi:hypothetical protein
VKTNRKGLWLTATAVAFLVAYLGGCKDENVATIGVCPAVVSTNPSDAATNVPLNQIITVTFNETMNPSTFTQESFNMQAITLASRKKTDHGNITKASFSIQGPEPVAGIVSFSDSTASFIPSNLLKTNTTYTGRITSLVKDLMGNALQTDYVWSFSTGANILPTVNSTSPVNNATSVILNKKITATFSVPMDTLTLT